LATGSVSNATAIPVTLPVLDALFSDEAFKTTLKSKVELSDDQVAQLQKISSEEVARLRQLNAEEQAVESLAFLRVAGKIIGDNPDQSTLSWLAKVMDTVINYVDTFSQINQATDVIFQYDAASAFESGEIRETFEQPGAVDVVQTLLAELPETEDIALVDFKAAVNRVKEKTKQKGKALFHPIRAALTGRTGSRNMAV